MKIQQRHQVQRPLKEILSIVFLKIAKRNLIFLKNNNYVFLGFSNENSTEASGSKTSLNMVSTESMHIDTFYQLCF